MCDIMFLLLKVKLKRILLVLLGDVANRNKNNYSSTSPLHYKVCFIHITLIISLCQVDIVGLFHSTALCYPKVAEHLC
jgi:hypothetical protein